MTETTTELDPTSRQWLEAYRGAKARREQADEEMARCREHIETALGNAEVATVDGEPAVTWKWSKGSARIDVKALREKEPELADQFTVTSAPVRKFLLVDPS